LRGRIYTFRQSNNTCKNDQGSKEWEKTTRRILEYPYTGGGGATRKFTTNAPPKRAPVIKKESTKKKLKTRYGWGSRLKRRKAFLATHRRECDPATRGAMCASIEKKGKVNIGRKEGKARPAPKRKKIGVGRKVFRVIRWHALGTGAHLKRGNLNTGRNAGNKWNGREKRVGIFGRERGWGNPSGMRR